MSGEIRCVACRRLVVPSEIAWNDGALAICRDCDEEWEPEFFPLQEGDIIW